MVGLNYIEMTNEQRRQLIDAQQTYSVLRPAVLALETLGSLTVQSSKGRRYMYEGHGKVRKSLGPLTPELLRRKTAHDANRTTLRTRVTTLRNRLEKMAPVNRALGIGTMRTIVARIVREIDRERLLGTHVIVAGTNALHAYETALGVIISQEHVATTDADLVWDGSQNLFLAASGVKRAGLLGILRNVDASFVADYGFNATNKDGFIVDLICPETEEHTTMNRASDLEATPMEGIEWLLAAPKFEQTIVGEDGLPCRIVVPEPRTFALHKLWVSRQDSRQVSKRQRDLSHAALVAGLIAKYTNQRITAKEMPWLSPALRKLTKDLAKLVRP